MPPEQRGQRRGVKSVGKPLSPGASCLHLEAGRMGQRHGRHRERAGEHADTQTPSRTHRKQKRSSSASITTHQMYVKGGTLWARKKSEEHKPSGNTNKDFHREPEAQRLAVLFKSEPLPLSSVMT